MSKGHKTDGLARNSAIEFISQKQPVSSQGHLLQSMQQAMGNKAVQRFVETRLTCSARGDFQEREDDHTSEEGRRIKRQPGASDVTDHLAPLERISRGGGQPLDDSVRSSMEPRFGIDFSMVRIHKDAWAAEAARVMSARAFTVGRDMYFGADEYAPTTAAGKRLLAHELTHVIQQGRGRSPMGMDRSSRESRGIPGIVCVSSALRLCRWTLPGTLAELCADPAGIDAVNVLKGYSVYSYDRYTYKRQYYFDTAKTKKKGAPEKHRIHGYHNRKGREIALEIAKSDREASSVLVHETVHAKQHKKYEAEVAIDPTKLPPTKKKKEYEAHIEQEKYNIRMKISPIKPSFRKKVKKNKTDIWIVDEDAIRKHVDIVYGIGPKKYFDDYDHKLTGKSPKPIGPWDCRKKIK